MVASDLVLAASGTVALEVAAAKRPMVISYRSTPVPLPHRQEKAAATYVGLPNILAGLPWCRNCCNMKPRPPIWHRLRLTPWPTGPTRHGWPACSASCTSNKLFLSLEGCFWSIMSYIINSLFVFVFIIL